MKWNCDKNKKWHRWFAWHPVKVNYGDCRWLEFVERRAQNFKGDLYWEFRVIEKGD